MQLDKKSIKRFSAIGARPVFGRVLLELAGKDKDMIVMVSDVLTSAGLERFKKTLPDQLIDVGIAEQNMMAAATGLSREGYHVVTATFAPFQSMRCLEQIRVNQGYMEMPLVMAGLASGLYHSYLGNTHCCFEDVAILRAIPGIAIVTPADGGEVAKALEAAVAYGKPVYIRLLENKGLPVVYEDDFTFTIGKANEIKSGEDVALIANGTMVDISLKVAKLLEAGGISVRVIDMHTVKPLDTEILDTVKSCRMIATIEEHNVIGGLGSAVAEYYASHGERPVQIMCGINDFYPHAGSYEEALRQCGLLPEQIYEKLLKYLQ